MSNVGLAKPQTITSAILTCSVLGTIGTDHFIKVSTHRTIFRIPTREDSGDGDGAPAFTPALWMYCSGSLNGWMVQAASPGNTFLLANLIDAAKNPLSASLKLNFATQQILTIPKAIITGCVFDYGRSQELIPMAFSYQATNSHPTWSTA